ncbi:membrane protein [Fictibacillus macauensis ZFHKF-1]|uniref:Membrane protein n=1 Tax=Fictibacillus macauensis ZFHKF-1 TaxID=1196324 RepID=I8IZE6_9BACL|nr:DMT family transporter [Fictibacillus macauensis]EIT84871.1 membrane protein [Fictibacillus macauensis ZFHKF-1]
MNKGLYGFCTLVWGLNFIAVKLQGNEVPLEQSLLYRLVMAGFLFFLLLLWKRPQHIQPRNAWGTVFLFGVCNLAVSYLLLYYATIVSSAAIVTMIFSMKVVFTPLALALLRKERPALRIILGGCLGIAAVGCLVGPTLLQAPETLSVSGIVLAFLGTIITSIGDVCSAVNAEKEVNIVYSNTVAFFVASIIVGLFVWIQGVPLKMPMNTSYWLSVMYLAIFASFFAWLFYLILVKNMGAVKSGYMVALFPAVGGTASVLIGESDVTWSLLAGCVLAGSGAFVALRKPVKKGVVSEETSQSL